MQPVILRPDASLLGGGDGAARRRGKARTESERAQTGPLVQLPQSFLAWCFVNESNVHAREKHLLGWIRLTSCQTIDSESSVNARFQCQAWRAGAKYKTLEGKYVAWAVEGCYKLMEPHSITNAAFKGGCANQCNRAAPAVWDGLRGLMTVDGDLQHVVGAEAPSVFIQIPRACFEHIADGNSEQLITPEAYAKRHNVSVSEPVAAAEAAAELDIRIYPIGIGTATGEPIPLRKSNGTTSDVKRDDSGSVVMSRLDELTLERIAASTSGQYYRSTLAEQEVDEIYNEIAELEKSEFEAREVTHYEERFQFLLVVALMMIFLESMMSERIDPEKTWAGRFE